MPCSESINRHVVKSLLRMLIALRVYRASFEGAFLDATAAFYEAEAQRLMTEMNTPDYLAHVKKRISEEVPSVCVELCHDSALKAER